MPTTPKGIWTPADSDDWDLTIDLAAMANSIDVAIPKQTSRVGTNAQRLALAGADLFEGLKFYTTDTDLDWRYNGSTWKVVGVAPLHHRLTSTTTITNTASVIAWDDTASYGSQAFTYTSGVFTCVIPGVYAISVMATLGKASAATSSAMGLRRNGSTATAANTNLTTVSDASLHIPEYLASPAVGDTIDVTIATGTGATAPLLPNRSHITMKLLGY